MFVSYMDEKFGFFSQYCRRNAGYYRNISRKLRREAEIAAHAAGAQQLTRYHHRVAGGDPAKMAQLLGR